MYSTRGIFRRIDSKAAVWLASEPDRDDVIEMPAEALQTQRNEVSILPNPLSSRLFGRFLEGWEQDEGHGSSKGFTWEYYASVWNRMQMLLEFEITNFADVECVPLRAEEQLFARLRAVRQWW